MNIEELFNLNDFSELSPSQTVNFLCEIFESGRESKNLVLIRKGIDLASDSDSSHFDTNCKMLFNYNLANGWSYLYSLTNEYNKQNTLIISNVEIEKQIVHYRLAYKYSKRSDSKSIRCQILTNLGNLFSKIGRFSEALEFWQEASEIDPNFSMAIGNGGAGLISYANCLYDPYQKRIFIHEAYNKLSKSIEYNPPDYAKQSFILHKKNLEKHYGECSLNTNIEIQNLKLGKSKSEIAYRKWCINNRLFLNPLNDVIEDNLVAEDNLFLPPMIHINTDSLISHKLFNQIKQEFVTGRFCLYEGLNSGRTHYSDRKNVQIDTLDYAVFSYNTERVKIAFRLMYSIFDKIGFFLNEYLELGHNPHSVSLKKIWFDKKKKGPDIGIHKIIEQINNLPFMGLYWLSKDLYEEDIAYIESIEPEAKEIAKIRNYIEHKSFQIVDIGETNIVDNGLTYSISRHELEEKALALAKLARAAILYLSLGVRNHESKKNTPGVIVPMHLMDLADRFKT